MSLPTYGQILQSNFLSGTGQNPTLAFSNPLTPGSLLIAAVTWAAASGSVSISDTANSVVPQTLSGPGIGASPAVTPWSSAPVYAADSTSTQFWFIPVNQKGGVDIVLASFSASQTFTLTIAEYFGGGQFLNQATLDGTSAGAGTGQTTVPNLSLPPFAANFQWDRASAFQGALAQSQIQQPGILLVGSIRFTALGSTPVSGITNRQSSGAVYAFGDSGPTLLSGAAAAAQNVGWTFTGVSTWDLVAAAFYIPRFGGIPS